jgi:hypothetical protein
MDVKSNAPRSIGEVFNDAIRIYRGLGPGTWLLAFALEFTAAVPSVAWELHLMPALAGSMQDPLAAIDALANLPSSPAAWLLTLIAIPVYSMLFIALIANINWIATGHPASVSTAIRLGLRLWLRTLLLAAAVACIVVVGFILLIVPGIYWAGILPLSFVALVIEDTGVSQSMAVSRGLIKGYWWSAATLISYVVIIELVAYFAGVLVTGGVGAILGVGGAATLLVSQVLSLAIDTLIAPLSSAVYVVMYHHLKQRKASAGDAGRVGVATKP